MQDYPTASQHKVLLQRWLDALAVPKHMRDAKIVTHRKNKGERGDCNNYRDISLLRIVKVFARVILVRLQKLAKRVDPESLCSFQAQR